jgi:single-strand DNA-binding protein
MENLKTQHMEKENFVTLTGFVGTQPLVWEYGNNFKKTEFVLGSKLNKEENKASWHKIIAFGKYANLTIEQCEKGARIWLKGKVVNRKYVNKNGEEKSIREISVIALKKLDKLSLKNN